MWLGTSKRKKMRSLQINLENAKKKVILIEARFLRCDNEIEYCGFFILLSRFGCSAFVIPYDCTSFYRDMPDDAAIKWSSQLDCNERVRGKKNLIFSLNSNCNEYLFFFVHLNDPTRLDLKKKKKIFFADLAISSNKLH